VGGGRNATLRKPTIGKHGEITPDEARKIALSWAAKARAGEDPSGERQERRKELTVSELATRYLEQHASVRKKPRSVEEDEGNLSRHILPALGKIRISEVTRKHVTDLHHRMKDKPTTANRVIALLSKMFNLAEAWGLRPDNSNPCHHVQKYKENKRTRHLSEKELARLGDALTEESSTTNIFAIQAIRLLIFTGARHNEIVTLTWQEVDFDHACLRLKDSKTGAKIIRLNPPALEILTSLPRQPDNTYVIQGKQPGQHLTNLERYWTHLRLKAAIEDVRLHDLRHTYASTGAANGLSLPVIGALLGHTQAATTQRYAHLADDPLKHATDAIGARIAAAMEGKASAAVISLSSVQRHG
jgi:integrase